MKKGVHPSQGSFSIDQELDDKENVFSRRTTGRRNPVRMLLSALRMSGHLLLTEAEALASTGDLSSDWPDEERGGK